MDSYRSGALDNLIQVLSPSDSSNAQNVGVAADGNLQMTMQEVLAKLNIKDESPHMKFSKKENLPYFEAPRTCSHSFANPPMLYDYTKLCKAVGYLPNPLGKFMIDEANIAEVSFFFEKKINILARLVPVCNCTASFLVRI